MADDIDYGDDDGHGDGGNDGGDGDNDGGEEEMDDDDEARGLRLRYLRC